MRRLILLAAMLMLPSEVQAQTTRYVCTSGTSAGGDATYTLAQLQSALNDSTGVGDIVLLEHGQTFTGSFTLPRHGNAVYATLKTGSTSACAASAVSFPAANIRVTSAIATSSNFATLRANTNNGIALRTADPSAGLSPQYWRVEYLKFASNVSTDWLGSGSLVTCGSDSNSVVTAYTEVPSNFIFSQVYMTGDATTGQFRGLSMHCNNFTLQDFTIEHIKSKTEGQAIFCNSFESGFLVVNGLISGGTEVILCGGSSGAARPAITVLGAPAPTTTTATLSGRSGLRVGKSVTFDVAGAEQHAEIVSCGTAVYGALCTSDAVVFTALTAAPDVPGDVDWGLNPGGFTLTKSHITRPLSMRSAIVGTPQSVTATSATTGGTLVAGTYAYRIVARRKVAASSSDNMAASAASIEVSATTTGTTGSVAIAWAAVTGASEYRVYGRSAGGQNLYFTTASTSHTDTGAAGTTGSVPTGTGTQFLVKNILEFKTMTGATINGNVFENTWWMSGGQLYAITLTPSNTGGTNDSTCLRDIEFTNNIVSHSPGGISLTGRDTSTTSGSGEATCRTTGIRFANTLFTDLNSSWGASANFMLISTKYDPVYVAGQAIGPKDVTLEHLTIDHGSGSLLNLDLYKSSAARPVENMTFRNIIARKASYGIFGNNSCTQGSSCWTTYTSGVRTYAKAVIADATCGSYPADTFCPTSTTLNAEFVDYPAGNYSLKPTSVYKNAGTDGTDIGAIIPTITALTNIALSGDNSGGDVVLPPSISTTSLPGGQVNATYGPVQLNGVCGAQPCLWSMTGAPTGWTLNTSTGVITQTGALVAGTYTVMVTYTDTGARATSRDFPVTISDVVVVPPAEDPNPIPNEFRADAYNFSEGVFWRRDLDPSMTHLDADGNVIHARKPVKTLDIFGDLVAGRLKYYTGLSPTTVTQTIANLSDVAAVPITITFMAGENNTSWPLTAAAVQFSASNDSWADLTGKTECRFAMRSNAVADGLAWVRYSTTNVVTATDLGTTTETPGVSMTTVSDNWVLGDWAPIAAGAKTFVRLGVWGRSPTNLTNGAVRSMVMVCR